MFSTKKDLTDLKASSKIEEKSLLVTCTFSKISDSVRKLKFPLDLEVTVSDILPSDSMNDVLQAVGRGTRDRGTA